MKCDSVAVAMQLVEMFTNVPLKGLKIDNYIICVCNRMSEFVSSLYF
jgi:hypothetical protein